MSWNRLTESLKKFPWADFLLVTGLILFDISVHPLGTGPDRLIHDPAVYRLDNPNYLPGDWYTGMAVASGVYPFYAALVNTYHLVGLPPEIWRQLLYILSLVVLYYSIIRISRLFSRLWLIVPLVAIVHLYLATGLNQPVWLYGPFMQIDGGLAPRSIGVAASFAALYFLLKGSLRVPAIILGLATLIHVSNSLIVYSLYAIVWSVWHLLIHRDKPAQQWRFVAKELLVGGLLYVLAGGWFALKAALVGREAIVGFSATKFIWTWIYYRAPYMALPQAGFYWWIRLWAHVGAIVVGYWLLSRTLEPAKRSRLLLLALIGLGSIGYFFLFYFFAFVKPWLLGFQFYSLRVVYLGHFVAYLFIVLSALELARWFWQRLLKQKEATSWLVVVTAIVVLGVCLKVINPPLDSIWRQKAGHNFRSSSAWLGDLNRQPPKFATFDYLYHHPEPFLAPPNWNTYGYYLPSVANYKSFGFTKVGLVEWYERLNDVSAGQLEQEYQHQKQIGRWSPVEIDWKKTYPLLTSERIQELAAKYHFRLFLTYKNLDYPFTLIAEDADYRLYQLPSNER